MFRASPLTLFVAPSADFSTADNSSYGIQQDSDSYSDEKENKIFLMYKEFRMEITASSYMVKFWGMSSYIWKPFLINDFATAPF
jgi:hypothetical protein